EPDARHEGLVAADDDHDEEVGDHDHVHEAEDGEHDLLGAERVRHHLVGAGVLGDVLARETADDEVPQLLEELPHVDDLRDDEAEVERCLEPAGREDQVPDGRDAGAGGGGGRAGGQHGRRGHGCGLSGSRWRGSARLQRRVGAQSATYTVSRYSSRPASPPSRPRPDCFTPPNGALASDTMPRLIPIMPASTSSATRTARSRDAVYAHAARPSSVALASARPSSSSPNATTGATGPKISSVTTRASGSTPDSTVGA